MMLFDRYKQVKAFVFAIDGVCTDGRVWISEQGERWCALHGRDRYAMQLAARHYPIALIGDEPSPGVELWMEELAITDIFVHPGDKTSVLRDWMSGNGIDAAQVLCMGSGVPDLASMALAGLGVCPADAAEEVKATAAYISHCNGGCGAVRDVIEKVMKLQNK
ncbi:MAG TPA: HAD hydrolase family protein [Parapedobacter sp.]|nr:HAD hydrolase family protein [Parapedobacter sp.]